jgi:peroxiredoxin
LGEDFQKRGVRIVAISSDEVTRGQAMADKVQGRFIEFAYGLDLGLARQWGLYISTSKGKTSIGLEEPALFSEPGVFLIKPDQTLYYGSTQTMPFAFCVHKWMINSCSAMAMVLGPKLKRLQ